MRCNNRNLIVFELQRLEQQPDDPVPLLARPVLGTLDDRALVLVGDDILPAVHDAHGVALAELLGATLWTANPKLLRVPGDWQGFVCGIVDHGIGGGRPWRSRVVARLSKTG